MIIDISSYQKVTDWSKLRMTPGLEGIYVKACEGVNAPDKGFDVKLKTAISLGIDTGVYHFCTLNNQDVRTDAIAEAKYFANLVKPYKLMLPYALDIESNPGKISREGVLLYIKSFFAELENQGIKNYTLYSYTPFLNVNLPPNHGLGHIKLWLAAYTPKPILPKGWEHYWLWQYKSDGVIDGITGKVDLNQKP